MTLGYTWFVGRVVNIFEPEKRFGVKVRCFGIHSFNISELPTEHLPWAEVLNPQSVRLYPGDIVMGYFQDRDKQKPVVYGKIEGIIPFGTKTETYLGELTELEKAQLPKAAQNVLIKQEGKPSINPLAMGEAEALQFTPVHVANENRAHVCDISNEMIRSASWVRLKFSEFMDLIRKGIRALLAALGASPEGVSARFKELAVAVSRELKKVQQIFKDIQNALEVFNGFIRKVRQLIEYILSLPAKLLALLQDCLKNLYASLTKGFAELFKSTGGSSDFSAITELAGEVKNTVQAAVVTAGKAAETAALTASTVATAGAAVQTTKAFKI